MTEREQPAISNLSEPFKLKWHSMGGVNGRLGNPLTEITQTSKKDGLCQHFEKGSVYWSEKTGVHELHGAIGHKYKRSRLDRELEFLGFPVMDEAQTADEVGAYQHFEGGSIFWHPEVDNGKAHEVHGAIREKWSNLDWERGMLGYPTMDESPTADGVGAYQHFQKGSIFWHPKVDNGKAHETHGAIRGRWSEMNWERGVLGYPTMDESPTGDGSGAYQFFENGSIFWRNGGSAHEVYGPILRKWAEHKYEQSPIGYPIGGVVEGKDGEYFQYFQHGRIKWHPKKGTQLGYAANCDFDKHLDFPPFIPDPNRPFNCLEHKDEARLKSKQEYEERKSRREEREANQTRFYYKCMEKGCGRDFSSKVFLDSNRWIRCPHCMEEKRRGLNTSGQIHGGGPMGPRKKYDLPWSPPKYDVIPGTGHRVSRGGPNKPFWQSKGGYPRSSKTPPGI